MDEAGTRRFPFHMESKDQGLLSGQGLKFEEPVDEAAYGDGISPANCVPSSTEAHCDSGAGAEGSDAKVGSGSESSSSSESSNSSSCETTDDELTQKVANRPKGYYEPRWKVGCRIFQNVRLRTLHLLPLGADTFVCGRKRGDAHKLYQGMSVPNAWKCTQCANGKCIRTVESANEALEAALKRVRTAKSGGFRVRCFSCM